MEKAVVYTLGCKVNQYESGAIAKRLTELGYEVHTELIPAPLYIVNTCAVTNEAERKSRQIVSRCRKLNPAATVAVCGCSAERAPDSFGADLTFGTSRKGSIVDSLNKKGVLVAPQAQTYEDDLISETQRVRAYIKVQDGCDNFCSYCIVPYLRGRSRSRWIPSILEEIARHAGSVKEFVITGINLSAYGRDCGSSLEELITALRGVDARVRLGSLEVGAVGTGLLTALVGLKRFCPHFHLSLQSGSDGVLARMNRRYTRAQYLDCVRLIRSRFPGAAITTDIIAGFPGETGEEHAQSCAFAEQVGFSDLHVFPYSRREGTAAAKLAGLPADVVKARAEELTAVKSRLKNRYLASQAGQTRELLTETAEGGYWSGYTENYVRCYLPIREGLAENRLIAVRLLRPHADGMLAQPADL